MELHRQIEQTRRQIQNSPLQDNEESIQLHMDFLEQIVRLAQQHALDHSEEWQNGNLTKEWLIGAKQLTQYESTYCSLCALAKDLAEVLTEHPRLRVDLLSFEKLILKRLNISKAEYDCRIKDLGKEINELKRNIGWADKGQLDKINPNTFFKTDPVEWTEKWENTIDEVYQKIEERMKDPGFVVGISLHYWNVKTTVLKEFGIDWKSPAKMNPDMIFD